jgi:hypothetical protein
MLRAMVVSYSSFIARNDDWAGDGLPCQDMMDVMCVWECMRCERVGVWTCRGGLQVWKMRCESGFG